MSLFTGTPSASAIFSIVSSVALCFPRSIKLMYVRWSFAFAPSASCDSPRSSRTARTLLPNFCTSCDFSFGFCTPKPYGYADYTSTDYSLNTMILFNDRRIALFCSVAILIALIIGSALLYPSLHRFWAIQACEKYAEDNATSRDTIWGTDHYKADPTDCFRRWGYMYKGGRLY